MMNSKLLQTLIIISAILSISCATTVETTMTKSWEKEVAFDNEFDLLQTQIHFTDNGDAVTLVSPSGVETVDSRGGSIYEVDRQKLFSIITSRGTEEVTEKITYIYLPHRHSLLEFNYSMTAESVTMINLDNREIEWVNQGLEWSLERYQVLVRAATKGLSFGQAATADAASQILLPKRFVEDMSFVIPELDALLFKALDGLKLINLENGEVLWTNEDIEGGVAKMIYDSDSNSIVVVNSDDEAFSIKGLQFNKQIARIDVETGSTIWTNSYDGNIREKLDGIGMWTDRKTDIRLLDDALMLNFLNVELYDFETGAQKWQTSEGANKMFDLVAPEAQIMNLFAFPVIHDGILYRVGFENVGLTGVDVIIEAFDKDTGELVWKSDKLSRSDPVNDMLIAGNSLLVSMGSSEGVIALDAKSGNRKWQFDKLGRNGIQHHMQKTADGVLITGKDKILLVDPDSGDEKFLIDTNNDGLGSIQDFLVTADGIAVSGEKGFATYNDKTGTAIHKIETPTGGRLMPGNDRLLIMPGTSSAIDGAFYVIDPNSGELKGTLGTDEKRMDWKINDEFNQMYVLTDNKVVKYVTN